MEKEQYNLFKTGSTQIPNIYFDLQSNYTSNTTSGTTIDMNPNQITDKCKNFAAGGGLNPSLNVPTDEKPIHDIYVGGNSDYNNFIYKYATSSDDDNMNDYTEPVKNQLKYLTCQVLKNKNKKFDTSNFTLEGGTQEFISNWGAPSAAIVIIVWCLFSFYIHIFKHSNLFFDKFKFGMIDFGNKNWKLYLMIAISVIILLIIGLSSSFFVSSSDDSGDTNLLFYEKINDKGNIEEGILISKWGFLGFLMLVFVLYYLSMFQSINISQRILFGVSSVVIIIGICLLFNYNNFTNQSIAVDNNDYNTGKNIYQSIFSGIKENFSYILGLLFLSVISYIVVLKFGSSSNNIIHLVVLLLSSFAFFLPLLILLFEVSFAIVNPTWAILSIVIFRFAFYIISYILRTFVGDSGPIVKILTILYEYPQSYIEKIFRPSSGSAIPVTDYPKNNPSGMPWNTTSINIIKIIMIITTMFTSIPTTYFTRSLK